MKMQAFRHNLEHFAHLQGKDGIVRLLKRGGASAGKGNVGET